MKGEFVLAWYLWAMFLLIRCWLGRWRALGTQGKPIVDFNVSLTMSRYTSMSTTNFTILFFYRPHRRSQFITNPTPHEIMICVWKIIPCKVEKNPYSCRDLPCRSWQLEPGSSTCFRCDQKWDYLVSSSKSSSFSLFPQVWRIEKGQGPLDGRPLGDS